MSHIYEINSEFGKHIFYITVNNPQIFATFYPQYRTCEFCGRQFSVGLKAGCVLNLLACHPKELETSPDFCKEPTAPKYLPSCP